MPLAASPQTVEPSFAYVGTERRQHAAVGRHREVGELSRRSADGSEPVAMPKELRLVDWRQDCHHRRLDNLVLDGGDF
jgi:hypothetical protein